MASIKPNNFPLKPLIDGTEELYTQTNDINSKFTVEDVKNYINKPLDNVLFVSTNGNDTTAIKGDINNTWRNPTQAIKDSQSEDIIIVFSGIYTIGTGGDIDDDGTQRLIKDDVIMYCHSNVIIAFINENGISSDMFSDDGNHVEGKILGHGVFYFSRTITGGDESIMLGNAESSLIWEYEEIQVKRRWRVNNMKSITLTGRKYTCREGQVFACRLPEESTNKTFIFNCHELHKRTDNNNKDWTHFGLRQFTHDCYIDINIDKYNSPHSSSNGWIYLLNLSESTVVNIKINSLVKTSLSFLDALIFEIACNHSRNYDINFNGALALMYSVDDRGETKSKSLVKIKGLISESNIVFRPFTYNNKKDAVVFDLDILIDGSATGVLPSIFVGSTEAIITGRITQDNGYSALSGGNDSILSYATLKNLILKTKETACIVKDAGILPIPIRIMDVYANNAPDIVSNGGITETVDPRNIVVDATV